MYPPTAPIKSKIDPLDSFGLEKAESATEKIRELCQPRNSPLHSLRDALAVFDRLESGDLHVREPIMGMSDWHYQFSYLCKEVFFAPWFIGTSAPEVWDHVRSALLKSQNLHEGSLEIRDESRLVVTPGVRRFRALSESELSEVIFYLQWGSKEWYHTTQAPQFYPGAVAPHLRSEAKDISPLAWAAARAKIVLGYSLDVGSDFAASFIIDIYLRASQYACNLCPESLKNSKEYSLEIPANKALLGQLRAAFGAAVAPEFYNLVFEIPGHFSAQVFESQTCKTFVEKLPHLLDQGLVIFRVSELISDCVKAGVSGAEAIEFALNLVTAIYGGKEKPWWFKEDFDLRLGLSTEELSQAKVRRQLLAVAKKGGFATEHLWPLYRGAGRAFAKETKISAKDALSFVAKVCLDYGIENPKRAALVLDFTKAYLLESAAKDRPKDLRKMQETLAYHKPKNEIVALLEGDNVSFRRTAMYPLLQLVAPEWDNEVRAAHELNLTATEVGEIIRRASSPVKDRSHLIPKLGAVTRAPLLAVYPERQSLELPVGSPPTSATKPLHAWQAIDRQARRECSKENVPETLATYLAVCGPKLEDPFRPPPGFLRLLEKILRIEDPRHRQLIFEHPDEREHCRQKQRIPN